VLSRKSSINKNSFYRSKAVGKLPEYLPNKPTVVGSRGQPYNFTKNADSPALPNLMSSGGIAGNSSSPYKKGSAIEATRANLGLSNGSGIGGVYNPPMYKYSGLGGVNPTGAGSGISGGIGMVNPTPYVPNY
jgi:hypothetical protein